MKKMMISLLLILLQAVSLTAQEDHLKVQFDFTKISGRTGRTVHDNVNDVKASMQNECSVVEMGNRKVMRLGNGTGYLNMTSAVSEHLRNADEFTVSVCYRVDASQSLSGNGHFLWIFAETSDVTETTGFYLAYRLNAQRAAISPAGFGAESGIEMGTASTKGRWMHMLYRQKGNKGELFINGHRERYSTSMPLPGEVFTRAAAQCWIGRSPFSGDAYLKNSYVADFRLYDAAVSDGKIYELAQEALELEREYRYGTQGDMTELSALMDECRQFIASPKAGIGVNSVAELQDALNMVEMTLDGKVPSQAVIDELTPKLSAALTRAQTAKSVTPKTGIDYESGRQGFVHPGALVTEEDIARARKMIFEDKNEYMVRAWQILCDNQWSHAGTATWPTQYVQRGLSGDNYMNAARGAHCAFQNALRWKIGGDRANADWAVQTLMNWCNVTEAVTGNTNISLAAGLYGYEFANAAELMRDYDGWAREDFEKFKKWMVKVWYNPAIDFLRRRHDTWANFRYPDIGERPGHYWSNWGLCNALCVMSIGILCDDVHMYNQGVSFYKYDHQGTFVADRSTQPMIYNDGCDEFIGNLVPDVLPDERGPFGYLGQMQESGRDQGHAVMALGCALDICQIGFNQGDDLFAYMDDRIAAGAEFVAAMNFGGVAAEDLPWHLYEYADCRGVRGSSWQMAGPSTAGLGERRPMWDRVRGYYEGLRGVPMQYSDAAAAVLCPDGGGGNYNANSGGYDHLGFTTLVSWRPAIDKADAITPLTGDIVYKSVLYKNQTNLGGLKYKYQRGATKAIPADGADIRLVPQLPDGVTDTGLWEWNTGETTRAITVRADRSFIYRVTYTAANGTKSRQAFAIAVSGDAPADTMTQEITVGGVINRSTEMKVLTGTDLILYAEAATGWTDDYLWDNGTRSTITTVPNITTSRDYVCQFANQSGAVSNGRFHIEVVPALQTVSVDGGEKEGSEAEAFPGSRVVCTLRIPDVILPDCIEWHDGSKGADFIVDDVQEPFTCTATYQGRQYSFSVTLKEAGQGYYNILTPENGYTHITSPEQLGDALSDSYFVFCSDEADLMLHMADGKQNGNKAMFYETPVNPLNDVSTLFTLEPFDGGYCLRNIDYDGLLLQTEMNAAWNFRTHDQPYACSWARFMLNPAGGLWTVDNGTYPGNWLGLWFPENGFRDGEELACNKTGDDIAGFQLFAIKKARLHSDYTEEGKDITVLVGNPDFTGNSWVLWTVAGTWGNQRFNGAAEVWHSTNFSMQQTLKGLPKGDYTVSCQMVNGEGSNTGYLFATAGGETKQDVVKQSCAGSNFDAERDKMAANADYAKLSVRVTVGDDGLLTFGLKEPSTGNTWLVWDNFRLRYEGDYTGVGEVKSEEVKSEESDGLYYDLQGRRIAKPGRGFYIHGGKKYVK